LSDVKWQFLRKHRPCFSTEASDGGGVRSRITIIPLVLAWICANGAIWDVVQVFAWGRMFAGYTQTMTIGAALRETFDPSRPCEMCSGIANAREAAKEQVPAAVEGAVEKIVLALHSPAPLVFDRTRIKWPVMRIGIAPIRSERVPVPPPRA
jgi:hypothetical protein